MTTDNFNLDDFNFNEIAKRLAERARKLRLVQNISQQALSKRSGVSLGSIKRFESSYEISLKHLLQLAIALGVQDDFRLLFPETKYESLDDFIQINKSKERKRASDV